MSIEQGLERIADALERLLVAAGTGACQTTAAPQGINAAPKKTRNKKTEAVAVDEIPGVEAVAPEVMDASIKTGAELRTLAQGYIQAAEASDPGGTKGSVSKLVTFIQSVAKIFNPNEPKLIKIPDAKVAEAASMIKNWCDRNGLAV
jgi:hypothetical protein